MSRRRTIMPQIVHYELNWPLFQSRQEPDPDTGCINWTGSINNAGYGLFRARDLRDDQTRMVTAHRIALTAHLGRPIVPGLSVHHSCHNRLCVNPDHLSEGTQQQKIQDMQRDGRFRHGPRGPSNRKQARQYRYTESEIQWIRSADLSAIQDRYGVSGPKASGLRSRMRSGYRWLPWTGDK